MGLGNQIRVNSPVSVGENQFEYGIVDSVQYGCESQRNADTALVELEAR